jgi:hypothetical protein
MKAKHGYKLPGLKEQKSLSLQNIRSKPTTTIDIWDLKLQL